MRHWKHWIDRNAKAFDEDGNVQWSGPAVVFERDDGARSVVPVSLRLLDDAEVDVVAIAQRHAEEAFASLDG